MKVGVKAAALAGGGFDPFLSSLSHMTVKIGACS